MTPPSSFTNESTSLRRSLRPHVALVSLLVVGLVFLVAGMKPGDAKPGSRPNIILIMVDDMGYSDIGCYGGEVQTPNLDKLAMAGVRFSNFHVMPACSPTRAALYTGVDPHLAVEHDATLG